MAVVIKRENLAVVSSGNIPELTELPELDALRVLIHSRLREWLARGRKFKTLAEKSNLAVSTVSRAAYDVNIRTHAGTIYKLAPHLGIDIKAHARKNW